MADRMTTGNGNRVFGAYRCRLHEESIANILLDLLDFLNRLLLCKTVKLGTEVSQEYQLCYLHAHTKRSTSDAGATCSW